MGDVVLEVGSSMSIEVIPQLGHLFGGIAPAASGRGRRGRPLALKMQLLNV
jgi:hypothetical protein